MLMRWGDVMDILGDGRTSQLYEGSGSESKIGMFAMERRH